MVKNLEVGSRSAPLPSRDEAVVSGGKLPWSTPTLDVISVLETAGVSLVPTDAGSGLAQP